MVKVSAVAAISAALLSACDQPQRMDYPADEVQSATTVEEMVPISTLTASNERFARCKESWLTRRTQAEAILRAERRSRDAMRAREDLYSHDLQALEEEKNEKARLEADAMYRSNDLSGCYS